MRIEPAPARSCVHAHGADEIRVDGTVAPPAGTPGRQPACGSIQRVGQVRHERVAQERAERTPPAPRQRLVQRPEAAGPQQRRQAWQPVVAERGVAGDTAEEYRTAGGAGQPPAFMVPMEIGNVAHRHLRQLQHPPLQVIDAQPRGVHEPRVQGRILPRQRAHASAFVASGDPSVPSRFGHRGEREQRQRVRTPGQQLRRGDRHRRGVEAAAEQESRGFGRPQRVPDRAVEEIVGGFDVLRGRRQADRPDLIGQVVVLPDFVRLGRDGEHLARTERIHVLEVGVARIAVVENQAAGEQGVVQAARQIAPREDGGRRTGEHDPAPMDREVEGRRPQGRTNGLQCAAPRIPDHGAELPVCTGSRGFSPAFPGAGEENPVRFPGRFTRIEAQRLRQRRPVMEESIEEYPAPAADLDEPAGGVILRRRDGRGLPDEAYGPDAPLGGPPGPERLECSGKTREMVGRDG